MPWSDVKVTFAGPFAHVLEYAQSIKYGEPRLRDSLPVLREPGSPVVQDPANKYRVRRTVKHLLQCNVGQWGKSPAQFLTLTFKYNLQDLKEAARALKIFIQKLNYHYEPEFGLKYLAVPEQQKRGAWHFHLVLFNLPYVGDLYRVTRVLWGHGSVDYQRIRSLEGATRYITKYLTKRDNHRRADKSFYSSRGLKRPLVQRSEAARHEAACGKLTFRKQFTAKEGTRHRVTYSCYSLSTNHGSN